MGGRRNQCILSSSAAACIIFAINNISTFVDFMRREMFIWFVYLFVGAIFFLYSSPFDQVFFLFTLLAFFCLLQLWWSQPLQK